MSRRSRGASTAGAEGSAKAINGSGGLPSNRKSGFIIQTQMHSLERDEPTEPLTRCREIASASAFLFFPLRNSEIMFCGCVVVGEKAILRQLNKHCLPDAGKHLTSPAIATQRLPPTVVKPMSQYCDLDH